MKRKNLMVVALALTGALGADLAQARGNAEVQWSVTIGGPVGGLVYSQPYPVYSQPYPVYSQPYPVHSQPYPVITRPIHAQPRHGYQTITHWDRDGDGIPNRFDRVYNPRWDRDGDGIPNWQDRRDGRNGRGR